MNHFYWQLPDGRVWGYAEGGWVDEDSMSSGGILSLVGDLDQLRERIRLYNGKLGELAEIEDQRPGDDYDLVDSQWVRHRFTKKDFLLLCGIPRVAALNAAINAGNVLAKTVHDLLFASEYIDVTDPDTVQMVQLLTTAEAGSVLTAEQATDILKGTIYDTGESNDEVV